MKVRKKNAVWTAALLMLLFASVLIAQAQETQSLSAESRSSDTPKTSPGTREAWAELTPQLGSFVDLPEGRLSQEELQALIETGDALFRAKFTRLDGAGRPGATQAIIPTQTRRPARNTFSRTSGPDANACSSCHNDPVIGGAGDFVTNVFVSEGFNNPDFDSTDPQFSNERGTNHLMGAGLLELLAREMSEDLINIRTLALKEARTIGVEQRSQLLSKGVSFGFITASPSGLVSLNEVEGVDSDLVVRPFSQKGVMTSLRQFTVNAMNHHHGMQAEERFGKRWTGTSDFDNDKIDNELSGSDISALVAWQAALEPPVQEVPSSVDWQQAAGIGKESFGQLGCADCHKPALPLRSLLFSDPGPLDVAGTLNQRQVSAPAVYDLALMEWANSLPKNEAGEVLVPLFGDLKRHSMTDKTNNQLGNELLAQRFVDRTFFMTSELWGIASTAPYGHRNDFTTLDEIIRAHGGDAAPAAEAWDTTSDSIRSAVIAYLKTLVIKP